MAQEITIIEPDDDYGPEMSCLNEQQRRFVYHYLQTGGMDATASAIAAGYTQNRAAAQVTAHRLTHNKRIINAVREEADRRLRMGAILASSTLIQIASDPMHKDQFRAACRILDQAGLLIEHKQTIEVKHTVSEKEKIEKVKVLAEQLGIDPVKLLGQAGVAIDAEFTPVKDTWED